MRVIYKCGGCGYRHDEESEAVLCCAPAPGEAYLCDECDAEHICSDKAEGCCGPSLRCPVCARGHAEKSLNGVAIRVAGHCNYCRALFTTDQVLAIADLFHSESGRNGCIQTGAVERW